LKVAIVGKLAKYVSFEDDSSKSFVITVLNNPFENLFNAVYNGKKINSKPVKIVYINDIQDLKETNIFYIPQVNSKTLSSALDKSKNRNILTISSTRGFAQRGGMIQLYFVSQKLKLKINTQQATKEGIKIKPMLLRISDIVKGGKQ
ncbi:MAG: YfiR family protein, partial [Campylobacterota bacterium]|nr:YfiR family protein [Campylobacterota bacterium]